MQHSETSKVLLEAAVSAFLKTAENGEGKLLYSLYYEQQGVGSDPSVSDSDSSLDLAFNDGILDSAEAEWRNVMESRDGEPSAKFMQFDERNALSDHDDDNEGY